MNTDDVTQVIFFRKGPRNYSLQTGTFGFIEGDLRMEWTGLKLGLRRLYLWNEKIVKWVDLATKEVNQLSFEIVNDGGYKERIKRIFLSEEDDSKILIRCTLTSELDTIIKWDVVEDIEINAFDVSNESEVFFGEDKESFILDHDGLIQVQTGAKSYAFGEKASDYIKKYMFFGIDKGMRVT